MAKGRYGGRRGGGVGLNPNDIVSVKSLVSEREGSQKLVDEVLSVFKDTIDDYGISIEDIQIAKLKGKSKNTTMAYFDGSNIAINETYFNDKVMKQAYKDCVASGFHPSSGNKTGLQATIAHEIGHKITDAVGVKMGYKSWFDIDKTATRIVNEARKETNHRGVVKMASKISKYATYSNAEAIAEAFSDVYCNRKNARAESKAIVSVINKYLKN